MRPQSETIDETAGEHGRATLRLADYYELCKPRVVFLIVFTAFVGMLLSTPGLIGWEPLILGNLGIALAASCAAALNHVLDSRIDALMARTERRPLPTGSLNERQALTFAISLGIASMLILTIGVNTLTAVLTFASLIGYAVIYTVWLKRATPQNIVIGGAAGAAPPVLGWAAVTGEVHAHALILFLIIFIWTPPHFWALAIARREEYARVDIPMLPVTHGEAFTRLHVLYYTVLLMLVTLLPYLTGMSGPVYLIGALLLNAQFMRLAWTMYREPARRALPMQTFKYSISYLSLLFGLLLVDHYAMLAFA
ncbi:MAG: heme o synthase [Pseudomonadota bacterium]